MLIAGKEDNEKIMGNISSDPDHYNKYVGTACNMCGCMPHKGCIYSVFKKVRDRYNKNI